LLTQCTKSKIVKPPYPYRINVIRNFKPNSRLVNQRWLLIKVTSRTLSVMSGDVEEFKFTNVAFGSGGVGYKRRSGDRITPIGAFKIGWINYHSKFSNFFGLVYPNRFYARKGLKNRVITNKSFKNIINSLEENRIPSQDTRLGGHVGIHGVGLGSNFLHTHLDWTDGCIAVKDTEIRKLSHVITRGMWVIIW
jgi:murein L,D-transpeptidase YafK